MEINSFLKIWSKKINDFYVMHPKSKISNIINSNEGKLNNFQGIKGILNLSLSELQSSATNFTGYIADILTTKRVKKRIDDIGIGYDGEAVCTINNNIAYDGLNFLKSNNNYYTTYAETNEVNDSAETTQSFEEYNNIFTNENGNIGMKCDLTYKESEVLSNEVVSNKNRRLMLKSHTPTSVDTILNFNVP